MSIDHKAWLFEHGKFTKEFAPLLTRALTTNDVNALREFIDAHREECADPEIGEPLDDGWDSDLPDDVQAFADVALRPYIHAASEMGLQDRWDALLAFLASVPSIGVKDARLLVMGEPFGSSACRLDPGRQGTGLVSARAAKAAHERLAERFRREGLGKLRIPGCYVNNRKTRAICSSNPPWHRFS